MPEIIDSGIVDALSEWCVECDDYWIECGDEHDGLPSCHSVGHQRAVTRRDIVKMVCPRCHGEGTLTGWPGAYTESDRAEWDDDDVDDYLEHKRICEDCNGIRVVDALTDEAYNRPIVQQWLRDMRDLRSIEAAERRAGA